MSEPIWRTIYGSATWDKFRIGLKNQAKLVPERTCENISDPPEGFLCSSCRWGDFAEPSHLLTSAKYTGRISGGPNYCPNCGSRVINDGR